MQLTIDHPSKQHDSLESLHVGLRDEPDVIHYMSDGAVIRQVALSFAVDGQLYVKRVAMHGDIPDASNTACILWEFARYQRAKLTEH